MGCVDLAALGFIAAIMSSTSAMANAVGTLFALDADYWAAG